MSKRKKNKDKPEQLELESKQRPGILKSKMAIIIGTVILIIIAGLFFYSHLKKKSEINKLYQEARQAESSANYDEAIKHYQKILEINPNNTVVYVNMANILYYKKDYQEAIECLNKLVELNPKNSLAYNNIGHILYLQGKYDEAIENIKKAIELKPNDILPYGNMGNVLMAQGKYDEALNNYRKCLTLDSNFIPAKANIAEVYLVTERFKDALEMATQVLKEKNLPTPDKMVLRFIAIASLVFQEKDIEAGEALQHFADYYRSINQEYEKKWDFKDIKRFINQNKTLKENKRSLLLELIDILESPKAEGDKKLKDLETWLKEK
ncbi:MAG: tetratricopeptide repeat protein [Candidatus Aminicenantes bacterium]|nr:MAG: tetratricopeptide repeat protein [Candidatus Aminicenantes bacterium]